MVSNIFFLNNNDSEKDLGNEILAFLATKQSVIQVRMNNTHLGQSANQAVAESMEKATLALISALYMCFLNFICLCGVAMAIVLNPLKMLIK